MTGDVWSLGDFGTMDLDDLDLTPADLEGFRMPEEPPDGIASERYLLPPLPPSRHAAYANAREFARTIRLEPGARTFAFVSGEFIFGEVLEAMVYQRMLGIRRLHVQTLSMSQENVDSLRNVVEMSPRLERLDVVASAYWYAHERNPRTGLVPYLYEELDLDRYEFRAAFASIHTKIVAIETVNGNHVVMHGSANLRSSNNIEQLSVECDPELYGYVVGFGEKVIGHYGTVNRGAARPAPVRGRKLWQAAAAAAEARAEREEAAPARRSDAPS